MLKIWAISDTHGFHDQLIEPDGIDLVIHSGDASNDRSAIYNKPQMEKFIEWYANLGIKYKVFVPGNHDTSIATGLFKERDFYNAGIVYLEHAPIEIEGIKIFGSPYTPSFGIGWAWNVKRGKLAPLWDDIPLDTDILVTHGPPKYMLDLSLNHDDVLEYCGDKELSNRIKDLNLKAHIFGHIHNCSEAINAGTKTMANKPTLYINASCVTDGRWDLGVTSNGHVFEL